MAKYKLKLTFSDNTEITTTNDIEIPAPPTKTSELTNDSDFITNTTNNAYRYRHNVRVYVANKLLLRVQYMLSKIQTSAYAATAPSTLAYLARAIYYAGATSQNYAIPATGVVYANSVMCQITGIYSSGTKQTNVYATVLPLSISGTSVPTETTVQLSSISTSPTINAYVKAQ